MTPEQILQQEAVEACLTRTQKLLIINAMDSYASQQAIAFAEWIAKNCYIRGTSFHIAGKEEASTIPALYTQFIEHQSNYQ